MRRPLRVVGLLGLLRLGLVEIELRLVLFRHHRLLPLFLLRRRTKFGELRLDLVKADLLPASKDTLCDVHASVVKGVLVVDEGLRRHPLRFTESEAGSLGGGDDGLNVLDVLVILLLLWGELLLILVGLVFVVEGVLRRSSRLLCGSACGPKWCRRGGCRLSDLHSANLLRHRRANAWLQSRHQRL